MSDVSLGCYPYPPACTYYYIRSRLNGLVLDVEGQNRNPGARVIMWKQKQAGNCDNQLWYDDPTTATIRSKLNDFCLDWDGICYSNTTVYYGIHKRSECIPIDSGVTDVIHDRRSCVDFTPEVDANVARCVHSSVKKPGVKRNSGL